MDARRLLDNFGPTADGALGLDWGASREEVFNELPDPARIQAADPGPSFFTSFTAILEGEAVHVYLQFNRGLAGVSMTPLNGIRGLEQALVERYGKPTRRSGKDPFSFCRWDLGEIVIDLDESPPNHPTITFLAPVDRPRKMHTASKRGLELEDLVPRSSDIQAVIDAGAPELAGSLDSGTRLALGFCPHCGRPIGAGHRALCPLARRGVLCQECRERDAECISEETYTCLTCAHLSYVSALRSRFRWIEDLDGSEIEKRRQVSPQYEEREASLLNVHHRLDHIFGRISCAAAAGLVIGLVATIIHLFALIPSALAVGVLFYVVYRMNRELRDVSSRINAMRDFDSQNPVPPGWLISLYTSPVGIGEGRLLARVLQERGDHGYAILVSEPIESSIHLKRGDVVEFHRYYSDPCLSAVSLSFAKRRAEVAIGTLAHASQT